MQQVRSEIRKQARIKRLGKAVELQMALDDRAAARSLQKELAELHRGSVRWAARFKIRVEPDMPDSRTSPVTKRLIGLTVKGTGRAVNTLRPASSWVVDSLGLKGVIWQQNYLGRKSPGFHHGAARENWEYIVRDEAVLLDASGEPVIISNMGEDWVEIGAAWQAMEDASTRANAKIQILAMAPFDSDMSELEMIAALSHFCKTVLEPLGLSYSATIHAPPEHGDQRNFHPHIAFSLRPMRRIERYCWEVADDVCGELDGRDGVQTLRHLWAHSMSAASEEAGSNRRYTGLGYGARGLDLEAGEHLGEARSAILARGGHVWAHERNRIRAARNSARRAIRDCDRKIEALIRVRDAAIKRIEQRVVSVSAARIIRAVPLVKAAETRPEPTTAQPVAAMTTAAAATSARTFASPSLTQRSSKASVSAVNTTIMTSPKTTAPSAVRTASVPANAARRLTGSTLVAPAGDLRLAPSSKPIAGFRTIDRTSPAAHLLAVGGMIPAFARTKAKSVRAQARFVAQQPVKDWHCDNVSHMLFDALAFARSARARRRRQRTMTGDLRLDTLPVLGDLLKLTDLADLDRLSGEAGSATSMPDPLSEGDHIRFGQLQTFDPYIAAYDGEDGRVETDYPALKAIGVGWDWLDKPGVQRALRSVRDDQQRIVTDLRDEATARPLAFAKTGTRFWPPDLPSDDVHRLNRWATDPGFEHDMTEMRWSIKRAHLAHDATLRTERPARDVGDGIVLQYPDGFGGMRQTPPPLYVNHPLPVWLDPFDAAGKPTVHLLRLLHLTGTHPHSIVIAKDGRMMVEGNAPALLAPLLHGWRNDDHVAVLVNETVRASRDAGQPVWPDSVARAVQNYANDEADTVEAVRSRTARRPLLDVDRGPSR